METCDCDAYDQIEMSEKCKVQSDAAKKNATSFQRKLLSPAFFKSSAGSQTSKWSFSSGPVETVNEWKPKFVEFCKQSSRMKSFSTWPKQMNPKPQDLARVGFFYEGVSDTCRCFFCGIIVHNWEVKDDAFEEHKRHSPNCHYLKYLM